MSCLYILEINSLSVASFAIIFSHSEGCCFILVIVSFSVQKPLSLIRLHLFILFLFPLFWEVGSKRFLLYICCSGLPIFFSKGFIVSGPTFKSLIHFEFAFVYGVRKCSTFIFLTCSCPVFEAPIIGEAVFFPLYILASYDRRKIPISAKASLSTFYLIPLVYILFLKKFIFYYG